MLISLLQLSRSSTNQ